MPLALRQPYLPVNIKDNRAEAAESCAILGGQTLTYVDLTPQTRTHGNVGAALCRTTPLRFDPGESALRMEDKDISQGYIATDLTKPTVRCDPFRLSFCRGWLCRHFTENHAQHHHSCPKPFSQARPGISHYDAEAQVQDDGEEKILRRADHRIAQDLRQRKLRQLHGQGSGQDPEQLASIGPKKSLERIRARQGIRARGGDRPGSSFGWVGGALGTS